ncbi:MAG: D-tyrosyl-tRNA(Tyr) deacylase [Methanocalculaceae archaeon]|jgi:D-aminoacyl-tRNA deacylase|nr:D-tyrosyl-tRNA(Tyr) deacylase [Methanocalculaceae archaeon]
MKIEIIHSTIDIAGTNIRTAMDSLIQTPPTGGWPLFTKNTVTFRECPDRIINATDAITDPDAELIIFLARHASVNPVPVLTVHPAGNFATADLGGNPRELGTAAPLWMRAVLRNQQKYVPEGFRVSYEITHHGPTNIHAPYFFVEVGSTEIEWRNEQAAHAAAKSILMADPGNDKIIPLISFGGTHYAVRQTAIALETQGAFGHMMHTRNIGDADAGMVRQMIEKSGAIVAHIDKKAMSRLEATHIEGVLRELGISEVTEGDLHRIGALPWNVWTAFAAFAKDIDPTAKLFPHGKIGGSEPASIVLPKDLFCEAFDGNEAELFVALDRIGGVFHATDRNGRVLPVLLTTSDRRHEIAGDLIALSIQQIIYTQGAAVEGDRIIITRRQFDARLARTQGVLSGPLFGKLAAGESVTLPDGRTVTPEMVTKTVQSTIHIPGLENYS